MWCEYTENYWFLFFCNRKKSKKKIVCLFVNLKQQNYKLFINNESLITISLVSLEIAPKSWIQRIFYSKLVCCCCPIFFSSLQYKYKKKIVKLVTLSIGISLIENIYLYISPNYETQKFRFLKIKRAHIISWLLIQWIIKIYLRFLGIFLEFLFLLFELVCNSNTAFLNLTFYIHFFLERLLED